MPKLHNNKAEAPTLRIPVVGQDSLGLGVAIDLEGLTRRYVHPGELEVLVTLLRSVKASYVVEIGVNEGRTAAAILRNVPTIQRYVGIDVVPDGTYKFECQVQKGEVPANPGWLAAKDPRFELFLSPDGSQALGAKDFAGEQVDAVFIDGDHSYRTVLRDTNLATSICSPGGIIIWHDYHNLETVQVRQVLEELLEQGRKLFHVENTWLVFERQ